MEVWELYSDQKMFKTIFIFFKVTTLSLHSSCTLILLTNFMRCILGWFLNSTEGV